MQSTTTGADGRYSFTVTPGTYSVAVVKPAGYEITGQDQGGNEATDSDINAAGQSGPVRLVSGQNNPDVDAGLYRLAELGDRVWYDSNANGVQDAGEAGVQGVEVRNCTGLLAPAGTPLAVRQMLAAQVDKTLQSPSAHSMLAAQGLNYTRMGPDAFGSFIRGESAKWEKVVREAGIQAD
mgnify:CR=1 FL=1